MKIRRESSAILEALEQFKKQPLNESADIQRTNFPADVDALEQHEEALKQNAERKDPENYSKEVKEVVKETASEESRYSHFDITDRKELAKKINEAKENGLNFKVARSLKEGFRYDLAIEEKLETAEAKEATEPMTEALSNYDKVMKLLNTVAPEGEQELKEAPECEQELKEAPAMTNSQKVMKVLDDAEPLKEDKEDPAEEEDAAEDVLTVGALIKQLEALEADKPLTWGSILLDDGSALAIKAVSFEPCDDGVCAHIEYSKVVEEEPKAEEFDDEIEIPEEGFDIVEPEEIPYVEDDLIFQSGSLKEAYDGVAEDIEDISELLDTYEAPEEVAELWAAIKEGDKLDHFISLVQIFYPLGVTKEDIDQLLIDQSDWVIQSLDLDAEKSDEEEPKEEEEEKVDIPDEEDEDVEAVEDDDVVLSDDDDVAPLDADADIEDDEDIEPIYFDEPEDLDDEEADEEKPVDESLKEEKALDESWDGVLSVEYLMDAGLTEEQAKRLHDITEEDDVETSGFKTPQEWLYHVERNYGDVSSYYTQMFEEEVGESLKEGEDKKVCPDCGKEICECDKKQLEEKAEAHKDEDKETSDIAEGFIKKNFVENDASLLMEAEEAAVKQTLDNAVSAEDEEVVAVDDEMVNEMLNCPSKE